jgi:hypothetical protein
MAPWIIESSSVSLSNPLLLFQCNIFNFFLSCCVVTYLDNNICYVELKSIFSMSCKLPTLHACLTIILKGFISVK